MRSDVDQRSSGVNDAYDAMHGNISLGDFYSPLNGQVSRIITAPFMDRLKRIKQLGFVSQNFLSAQHNRYAHALGTAHIMRRLIRHLEKTDLFEQAQQSLFELTEDPEFDPESEGDGISFLKQHLLVAALIQDIGELPYETACRGTFRAGEAILAPLRSTGVDLDQMKEKAKFTLYFLWYDPEDFFKQLNKTLLTYFISGLVPGARVITPPLAALREMLDGRSVDADRIDYVYRDAFHTTGVKHSADSLIASIVSYDEKGVVLSHVRPVTDFMVTRAMLWSNVYLSPENRFRIILLKRALTELFEKLPATFREYFGFGAGEITPEDFLALDDNVIDRAVRKAVRDKLALDRMPFELLENGAPHYHYRWVAFSETHDDSYSRTIELPRDFFWDTYADYRDRDHTLYEHRSIRVIGERYALIANEVGLEDCIGPFSRILKDGEWPAFPMPNHMVWFGPAADWTRPRGPWATLVRFKGAQQLTQHLQFRDPITGVRAPSDTRGRPGFKGPPIFLAFSWADHEYLDRFAAVLVDLKREFWSLTDGYDYYGASTASNSQGAVDDAGAIILLASKSYAQTYSEKPDEGLHAEVSAMVAKRGKIPIIPVALDSYSELTTVTSFPWKLIGADGAMAFVGEELRRASSQDFRRSVENVVKAVDRFWESKE